MGMQLLMNGQLQPTVSLPGVTKHREKTSQRMLSMAYDVAYDMMAFLMRLGGVKPEEDKSDVVEAWESQGRWTEDCARQAKDSLTPGG